MKEQSGGRARARGREVARFTLAIDIGGTGLKASVLDPGDMMVADPIRLATPRPSSPKKILKTLREIVDKLPPYDRVSVGFPGVVRHGRILTAPHLGTEVWHGFDLAATLSDLFGKPTRILNDADIQGFGVIAGRGLECVLTFGTGLGSALFQDGRLAPHLELSLHPIRKKQTYNDYVGDAALHEIGRRKWNRRVAKAIATVRTLVNFDVLYLGGGNARKINLDLPGNVHLVSNAAGITGGIHLWDPENDVLFEEGGGTDQVASIAHSPPGNGVCRL